jgi:Immunoglobulin domain
MKPKSMIAHALLCLGTLSIASGAIISWNYDYYGTISSSDSAGIAAATHWNNSWPSNPVTDLMDDTGTSTTLDISYSSYGGWHMQGSTPSVDTDGSVNKRLLNGYLNSGPAGWGPWITYSSVTLSQIPYPKYKVIVYFSADVADREGYVTDGTTNYYFKSVGPNSISGSNATFAKASDTTTAGYSTAANYAEFDGLTGTTQTLTVQMRDNDEWGGIAGFQIVADLTGIPQFGLHPQNTSAVADPAPEYQWQYSANGTTDWNDLPGEVASTLSIYGASFENQGYYRVIASNSNGTTTSNAAYLTVYYENPAITTQPTTEYVESGSGFQLSVEATGYGNLSYQWYKDGNPLSGQTSSTLSILTTTSTDAGVYYVRITDDIASGIVSESSHVNVYIYEPWNGLVSHEPFDTTSAYTVGRLPSQNPTITGYSGAWTDVDYGNAEPAASNTNLTYTNPYYLGSSGGSAGKDADTAGINISNCGRTYRSLEPRLIVANNTSGVRYVSWLYKNGNENAAPDAYVHSVMSLHHNTGGSAPAGDASLRNLQVGISSADLGSNNYGLRYNNSDVLSTDIPCDGNVHLFVMKLNLSSADASDSVTLWIDPSLGSGEPSGGVTLSNLNIQFESIALSDYASNSAAWDEFRWGSSFDSVTLGSTTVTSYSSWIAGYTGVGSLTGFNDDADHDGLPNGLEYYFGSDPSTTTQGIQQVSKSGSTLTFQHPNASASATGITASYRWSTDLSTWHDSGSSDGSRSVTITGSSNTPSSGVTTATATITGTQPESLFITLQVLQAP